MIVKRFNLVSWCFESSQPLGILLWLKTIKTEQESTAHVTSSFAHFMPENIDEFLLKPFAGVTLKTTTTTTKTTTCTLPT